MSLLSLFWIIIRQINQSGGSGEDLDMQLGPKKYLLKNN
jgi:hypothetical protein